MRYCTPFVNFKVGLKHGTYTRASWFSVTYDEANNISRVEMKREEYEGSSLVKKRVTQWGEKGDANRKFSPDSRVKHRSNEYTNVYLHHEKSAYDTLEYHEL